MPSCVPPAIGVRRRAQFRLRPRSDDHSPRSVTSLRRPAGEAIVWPVAIPSRKALKQAALAVADDRLPEHRLEARVEILRRLVDGFLRRADEVRRGALRSALERLLMQEAQARQQKRDDSRRLAHRCRAASRLVRDTVGRKYAAVSPRRRRFVQTLLAGSFSPILRCRSRSAFRPWRLPSRGPPGDDSGSADGIVIQDRKPRERRVLSPIPGRKRFRPIYIRHRGVDERSFPQATEISMRLL
jgi:hypothetical protein